MDTITTENYPSSVNAPRGYYISLSFFSLCSRQIQYKWWWIPILNEKNVQVNIATEAIWNKKKYQNLKTRKVGRENYNWTWTETFTREIKIFKLKGLQQVETIKGIRRPYSKRGAEQFANKNWMQVTSGSFQNELNKGTEK